MLGIYKKFYFVSEESTLDIFPGIAIFCVPQKPKTDAVKFCLISLITVCKLVPAGKLAAFFRPSLNNFQPNMMLNNRMKKVITLEIKASNPTQKNTVRIPVIVLAP